MAEQPHPGVLTEKCVLCGRVRPRTGMRIGRHNTDLAGQWICANIDRCRF